MTAVEFYYLALVSPLSVMKEIKENFQIFHLVNSFVIQCVSMFSILVGLQIISGEKGGYLSFFLQYSGVIFGFFVGPIILCAMIHAGLTSFSFKGNVFQLLSIYSLSSVPYLFCVNFALISLWLTYSETMGALGPVLFIFSFILLLFYSIRLFSQGIGIVYEVSAMYGFISFILAVFFQVAMNLFLFASFTLSFLAVLV